MWNMFAEPYHFTSGGFPITKQVSHLVASQRPGVPLLSGFFGDPTVRGSQDRLFKKPNARRPKTWPLSIGGLSRSTIVWPGSICSDPKVIARADDRILAMLRERIAVWEYTQHAFLGVTLFFHQRHFMGNNVAQLLHLSDFILPFMSWECIDYKMQNDPDLYGYDTYGKLLATCFPEIGNIPHNSQMGEQNNFVPRPQRLREIMGGGGSSISASC